MSFYDLFEEEPFKEVFKEVEAFTSRKFYIRSEMPETARYYLAFTKNENIP